MVYLWFGGFFRGQSRTEENVFILYLVMPIFFNARPHASLVPRGLQTGSRHASIHTIIRVRLRKLTNAVHFPTA